MKLGFSKIEGALQEMHDVPPVFHPRFKARLRYLQRAGFGIPRAGAGRKANFTVGHALLFAIGLELQQFGLEPERLAEAISESSDNLREATYEVVDRQCDPCRPVLLFFYPQALVGVVSDEAITPGSFGWSEAADVNIVELFDGVPRWAFINLTAVIAKLVEGLAGDGDRAPYFDALVSWANQEEGE